MNERKKILILGAGRMGRVIAEDLAQNGHEVTVVDNSVDALEYFRSRYPGRVGTIHGDLRKPYEFAEHVLTADLVIGAMPPNIAFHTLEVIIGMGKNIVDISFFPEDPFALHDRAYRNGVKVIVDAGVAPGMSNAIAGYENGNIRVDSFVCMVGGLPVRRDTPTDYLAPFSPESVVDEYVRPARIREHRVLVTKPALSDPEPVMIPGVGMLTAFLTDGLRTLLSTMKIPHMAEKTLRYPKHFIIMEALRDTGFFSEEHVALDNLLGEGYGIKPLDLTRELLTNSWRADPNKEEFTVMHIEIKGRYPTIHGINGKDASIVWDMRDDGGRARGHSSMARTTGFMASAVAELVLAKKIPETGVIAPEQVGARKECFQFLLAYMLERGVEYRRTES